MNHNNENQPDQDNLKQNNKIDGCTLVILAFAVIVIIFVIINGNTTPTTPHSNNSSRSNSHETKHSAQKEVLRISALDLWSAYDKNEVAADLLYMDKVLIVTGAIENISKDILNTAYVTLKTGNTFESVQCMFSKSEEYYLASLSKGQQIQIQGTCAGVSIGNIIIRNCTIID